VTEEPEVGWGDEGNALLLLQVVYSSRCRCMVGRSDDGANQTILSLAFSLSIGHLRLLPSDDRSTQLLESWAKNSNFISA